MTAQLLPDRPLVLVIAQNTPPPPWRGGGEANRRRQQQTNQHHGLVPTPPPRPGGGGIGGSEEKKTVRVPKIGLKFPAPLINFIFCPRTILLMWVGGWVGQGPKQISN